MADPVIAVRPERPEEIAAIREINASAFGQADEADIVDRLRANGGVTLSLVATVDGRPVGHHILSSPADVDAVAGAALGPMAVAPDHQRRGIVGNLPLAGDRGVF